MESVVYIGNSFFSEEGLTPSLSGLYFICGLCSVELTSFRGGGTMSDDCQHHKPVVIVSKVATKPWRLGPFYHFCGSFVVLSAMYRRWSTGGPTVPPIKKLKVCGFGPLFLSWGPFIFFLFDFILFYSSGWGLGPRAPLPPLDKSLCITLQAL